MASESGLLLVYLHFPVSNNYLKTGVGGTRTIKMSLDYTIQKILRHIPEHDCPLPENPSLQVQ